MQHLWALFTTLTPECHPKNRWVILFESFYLMVELGGKPVEMTEAKTKLEQHMLMWKWDAQHCKCLLDSSQHDIGQHLRGAQLHRPVYYTLINTHADRTLTSLPACWATADMLCRPECTAEHRSASSSSSAHPRASSSLCRTPLHLIQRQKQIIFQKGYECGATGKQ